MTKLNHLPLPLFLAGLVALYLGERTLMGLPRAVVDSLGGVALMMALGAAFGRFRTSNGERQRAHGWVIWAYLLCIVGLALYGLCAADLGGLAEGKLRTVLMVAWPGVILLGIMPALAMELAIGSMVRTPSLEIWRVALASRAARILAFAVIAFAGVNYAANTWNRKIDLSYFKTTQVGTSTAALVRNLTQPVRFVLFFPPGNDVLQQAKSYFDELAHGSTQASVEVVDQALEPERAKELRVRSNGYLAINAGKNTEVLHLDLDAEEARGTLRNLDAEVQQRLLKVIRPERVAYLTTGHNERDYIPGSDDKRLPISDFKTILESQGFSVRRLGLGEGLGTEVPKDATVVLVMGPQEAFSAMERNALHRYLTAGGRLFVAIDPDHGVTEDELLAPLGVKVSKPLVANERYLVRVEGRGETPYDIVTTRASTHPTTSTLAQNPGRMGMVMLGAGSISKLEPAPAEVNVTMTLHAMPQSWLDKNSNGKFDQLSEQRDNYELAAAVERTLAEGAPTAQNDKAKDTGAKDPAAKDDKIAAAADPNKPANPSKPADANKLADASKQASTDKPVEARHEDAAAKKAPAKVMRAVVIADADFAGDGIMRNPGNAYFIYDSMRWLGGEEQNVGTVESEKDVPLLHRKEDDAVWFYGVSFLVPAAVLVGGLTFTRRAGRSRRRG